MSPYFQKMLDWVNHSIDETMNRSSQPSSWKLMMGCVAYGEKYTNLFLRYCIPSLLSEGNRIKPFRLVIHTDAGSISKIKSDHGFKELIRCGDAEIHTIPQDIIDETPKEMGNKYWLLGAVHNIQMQMAKFLGYSFHMLMPDHVYSSHYFTGLKRLAETHDAIVQGALSANIETINLSHDGILSVMARDLNARALDHLHSMIAPYVMNGSEEIPMQGFLIYIGQDVHILCPHISPVYLSYDILKKCPLRLFNTIDTQLPFFIPEWARVTAPSVDDDMSYIEISDGHKNNYHTLFGDELAFAVRFWMLTFCEKTFLRYFNLETRLGLPPGYKPHFSVMNDETIEAEKKRIRDYVAGMYDHIRPELEECYQKDPLPQRAE